MLQNECLVAKIGVDRAENEPPKECCVVVSLADVASRPAASSAMRSASSQNSPTSSQTPSALVHGSCHVFLSTLPQSRRKGTIFRANIVKTFAMVRFFFEKYKYGDELSFIHFDV